MNKRQIQVQKKHLKNEKEVIKELKDAYRKALAEIEENIEVLQEDKATPSKVRQLKYQESLRAQVSDILDKMHEQNFNTISEYLDACYTDGFVGTMFDLQGQGIPLAIPIDQLQVVKAITLDSKISQGLYKRLGFNSDELKKTIVDEISRGIANGYSYQKIARNLELHAGVDYRRSLRIARTEGHRVQQSSAYDCQVKAKASGADVKKQWDSTLDGETRRNHRTLDGQIVEVGEAFEVDGKKAMFPGDFGDPKEDCNCRCCILQRAAWNLDDYEATKYDGEYGMLLVFKEADYDKFKTAYFDSFGKVG